MDTYFILQVSHGEYKSFQQITFFLNTFLKITMKSPTRKSMKFDTQ